MRIIGWFTRGMLVLLAFMLLRVLMPPRLIDMDAPVYDPAIERELSGRSDHYGAVDRWAYPGMEGGLFAHRLRGLGYECAPVQDLERGGTPEGGVHTQNCARWRSFPARELIVQADVDYDRGQRITAVRAYSLDSRNGLVRGWTSLLRAVRLIEPARLRVRGLSFESSAHFARYVVDRLNPWGWSNHCAQVTFDRGCQNMNEERFARGFPEIAIQSVDIDLPQMVRMLRSINVEPGPIWDDETVPLRIEGDTRWLDLAGADFDGLPREVSIEVGEEGGAPLGLVVRYGADAPRVVDLVGRPRRTGSNESYRLEVVGGYGSRRTARWVVPGREEQEQGQEPTEQSL
jgi:hypothetical protein